MKKTRVLIVGGGFGDLYAALEFEKRRFTDIEVTLISEEKLLPVHPDAPRSRGERPGFNAHCQSDPKDVTARPIL